MVCHFYRVEKLDSEPRYFSPGVYFVGRGRIDSLVFGADYNLEENLAYNYWTRIYRYSIKFKSGEKDNLCAILPQLFLYCLAFVLFLDNQNQNRIHSSKKRRMVFSHPPFCWLVKIFAIAISSGLSAPSESSGADSSFGNPIAPVASHQRVQAGLWRPCTPRTNKDGVKCARRS